MIQAKPSEWDTKRDDTIQFNIPYTTSSFPPDMDNDQDLKSHELLMSSGNLRLVNPRGKGVTGAASVDLSTLGQTPRAH